MINVARRLALVLCATATAGCALTGTGDPSAAAIVGDEQIPIADIEQPAEAIASSDAFQQQSQGGSGAPEQALQAQLVNAAVLSELLEQVAQRNGIEVTDAQVTQAQEEFEQTPGGPEQLDAAREQGLSEALIARQFRDLELQEALRSEVPEGTDLAGFVRAEAEDLTVEVNPRFGRWNDATLQVEPADPLAPELPEQLPSPAP